MAADESWAYDEYEALDSNGHEADDSASAPRADKSPGAQGASSRRVTPAALEAFDRRSADRTEDDVSAILDMARGLAAFDNFTEATQRELCGKMRYMACAESDVVFHEGDEADGWYVILSGSVYGLKKGSTLGGTSLATPEASRYRSVLESVSQVIFRLHAGEGFGEGALQESAEAVLDPSLASPAKEPGAKPHAGVRSATIKCAEPTELLVLSLEDYRDIVAKALQRELEAKVSFLATLPIFLGWAARRLNDCAKCFTIERFAANRSICLQGQDTHALWIVWTGQVRVLRQVAYRGRSVDPLTGAVRYESRRVLLEIAQLSEGELFGELAITRNEPHSASVIAACKCVVLKLPRSEFAKHITGKTLLMVESISRQYPSDETLLARYNERRTWEAYKRQLVGEVLKRKADRRVVESFRNPSAGFAALRGLPPGKRVWK